VRPTIVALATKDAVAAATAITAATATATATPYKQQQYYIQALNF
jgi:hypothetical protein